MLRFLGGSFDSARGGDVSLSSRSSSDDEAEELIEERSSPSRSGSERTFLSDSGYVVVDESKIEWASLELDVYGAAVYSIVHGSKHSHDDLSQPFNLMRVVLCGMALLLNLVLQSMVVYFTYFYLVKPSVHDAQEIYADYHLSCFEKNGVINMTKWDQWGGQERLCNMVFANKPFLYVMLLVWWLTMLYEFRQGERLFRTISNLAHNDTIEQLVQRRTVGDPEGIDSNSAPYHCDDDGKEYERVIQIVCPVRAALYVLVVLPRMCISVALLLTGTIWLAATSSVSDLVLNAVALVFVVDIDVTLFDALFPHAISKRIETFRIAHVNPNSFLGYSYLRSVVYTALCFGGVALYLSPVGQSVPYISVLPEYANDALCPAWWEQRSAPRCGIPGSQNCFPYGR